jgi:hypothetical protein
MLLQDGCGLPRLTRRRTTSSTLADAPTTLPDPMTSPNPLPCEDEDESEDALLMGCSELRQAQQTGRFRDRAMDLKRFNRIDLPTGAP